MKKFLSLTFLMIILSLMVEAQQGRMKSGDQQGGNSMQSQMIGGQMMGGEMHEKMMKQLMLTDQQKKSIDQSMLAAQKKIQPLNNQLNEAIDHQKTLLSTDHPDMNAIDQNLDKIGKLKTEISKIHARYMVEFRSQLNEEQRRKFDKMQVEMMDQMNMKEKMNMRGMNN